MKKIQPRKTACLSLKLPISLTLPLVPWWKCESRCGSCGPAERWEGERGCSEGRLAAGVVRSSAGVSNKDLRSRDDLELVLFLPNDYSDKEMGSGVGRRKCDTL